MSDPGCYIVWHVLLVGVCKIVIIQGEVKQDNSKIRKKLFKMAYGKTLFLWFLVNHNILRHKWSCAGSLLFELMLRQVTFLTCLLDEFLAANQVDIKSIEPTTEPCPWLPVLRWCRNNRWQSARKFRTVWAITKIFFFLDNLDGSHSDSRFFLQVKNNSTCLIAYVNLR